MYRPIRFEIKWAQWITTSVSPVKRAGVTKRQRRDVKNTLNTGSHGTQILTTGTISDLVMSVIMDTDRKASSVLYESLVNDTVRTAYKRVIRSRKR